MSKPLFRSRTTPTPGVWLNWRTSLAALRGSREIYRERLLSKGLTMIHQYWSVIVPTLLPSQSRLPDNENTPNNALKDVEQKVGSTVSWLTVSRVIFMFSQGHPQTTVVYLLTSILRVIILFLGHSVLESLRDDILAK